MSIKKIITIVTLVLMFCTLIGTAFTLDARYAKAAELTQLSAQLTESIDSTEANAIEQRLWRIEDRNGGLSKFEQWPSDVRQDYREQERKMKELRTKYK